MNEPIRTYEYRGHTIEIYPDFDPPNPREWDNLAEMACYHPHYNFGDFKFKSAQAVRDHMASLGKDDYSEDSEIALITWLSILDHSGVWLKAGTSFREDLGGWDTSRIGFAYVTKSAIEREYGEFNEENREKARQILAGEIATYAAYVEGDVFGFVVKGPDGEIVDKCFGFYGWHENKNYALEEARRAIDWHIEQQIERHARFVKIWIKHKVPLIHRSPLDLPYAATA